jgi:predicted transglutaminase-like cysteine proteinase
MSPAVAALAVAALAVAAPDSGVAATAAHRHAAAAPASRCRRAAGRCALPKNSRMINYVE